MAELVADRFELVDRIGSGGVGTVWRAYDHELHRYCAAKLVRRQEPEALLRVLRERSLRLSHPHVLSPYAWASSADAVLVASDLVHGGSLAGLVRDHGALPWRYAAEIVAQLLDALAHVHATGLVHRDVKPANVLLEATGQGAPHVRLADFGIAYLADAPRLTESGFVVGTPGYLAPEALAGHPPHPTQDLYSVGVLAWQLLAGAERPEPRTVAVPLWPVMRALLAENPAARPPDAATARHLLTPILAEEPLTLPAMTADGEPIEVFDVLPPLPPAPPAHESPTRPTAPKKVVHTPQQPAVLSPPGDRMASGPPPGIGWGVGTPPTVDHGKWRWWLAAAGGLVLAGAVGLGVLLSGGTATAPDKPVTVPEPPSAGERCEWQDVASTEVTDDGAPVRCVRQPDGSYLWEPA